MTSKSPNAESGDQELSSDLSSTDASNKLACELYSSSTTELKQIYELLAQSSKEKLPDRVRIDESPVRTASENLSNQFEKDFESYTNKQESKTKPRTELLKELKLTADLLGEKVVPFLINKLDSKLFAERQLATNLLVSIGPAAISALTNTLKKPPSLDVVKRIENEILPVIKHSDRYLIHNQTEKTPLPLRDKIEAILLKPQLEQADLAQLKSCGHHSVTFIVRDLMDLTRRYGNDALKSERGQQLLTLLKSEASNKDISPALFVLLDSPSGNPALKEVAQQRLIEITSKDKNPHPDTWLYDSNGNLRRAGTIFQADYVEGKLIKVKCGDDIFEDLGNQVVRHTYKTNTGGTATKNREGIVTFTVSPSLNTKDGHAAVNIDMKTPTGSEFSHSRTIWLSAEQQKRLDAIWKR